MAASTPQNEPKRANPGPGRHFILGTAGHIDHGKTALVRALTGINTDRLPEERRRGMTIELGFAELVIGDATFGVVDVPGHERFVRTMVSGATGMDLALIVVAADDSVMPQTIEHVEILNLLGIRRAIVAITKIDIVEPDMVELVAEDVTSLLAKTPLAAAPLCRVSSITGEGIDVLMAAILAEAGQVHAPSNARPFRMSVDRAFSVQGRGTVVTGSVHRGTVAMGDALQVWPGGATARVRGLQAHGATCEELFRGQRAAINLTGVALETVQRGAELATPGYLEPARMLDVRLECLATHKRPIKSSSVARLGIGTAEVPVRVVLLDRGELAPGETACAQLRSGVALTAEYGQRLILRDETAARTIAGGVVLRPVSRRRRHTIEAQREALDKLDTGDDEDRVEQALRFSEFVPPEHLHICARAGVEMQDIPAILDRLVAKDRLVTLEGAKVKVVPAAIEDLTWRLVNWLERYHRTHPDAPGRSCDSVLGWLERMATRALARPLLDRLTRCGVVKPFGRFVCLPQFAPQLSAADEKYMAAMVEEIRAGAFQPPSLDALSISARAGRKRLARLATLAVATGDLVPIDAKLYLHAEVERRLRQIVSTMIEDQGAVTVAQVRQRLDSTRKFVVPLLEYLDRLGFTKRVGDQRVLAEAADVLKNA